MRTEHLVRSRDGLTERRLDARIVAVTDVPEDHEGVPPQVPRLAPRDVPASVPRQQLLVRRLEQLEQRHPWFVARPRRRWRATLLQPVRWADLLAVVASVEAVAECLAELHGEV